LFLPHYIFFFEGRGIFINTDTTTGVFIVWVGEEDQTRIMAMNKGSDVQAVWNLFYKGLEAVHKGVKAQNRNLYMFFCFGFSVYF
jgi:hypothetical protein